MFISITIHGQEIDVHFNVPTLTGEWVGLVNIEKEGKSQTIEPISFQERDGVITNLSMSNEISTPRDIVLERIIEMLKEYRDTLQMGFEAGTEDELIGELKPYDPELIKVRPINLSAFEVSRFIDKRKLDLNPDFQRNFVWNDAQKSRLIESMLLKIPLPAFYFAEDKFGNYTVVDGLQRLTVINQFLNNKFKLRHLQYLDHLTDFHYKDLGEPYGSRVEMSQLNINVIEATSPLKIKYDIFYRINTGGRPLNQQEIRNCFAKPAIRELLERMAHSNLFIQATDHSISDTRMDAQELALRFLGLYFYRNDYGGYINPFLNEVLERLNVLPESQLLAAEEHFYKSLQNAIRLFDRYAFRKILPRHLEANARKQFINKAMFMVWTVILAESNNDAILAKPIGQFATTLANELSWDSDLLSALTIGTTNTSKLNYVFNRFGAILHQYLNI